MTRLTERNRKGNCRSQDSQISQDIHYEKVRTITYQQIHWIQNPSRHPQEHSDASGSEILQQNKITKVT